MPTAGLAARGVEAFIDLVVCYVLPYSIAAIAGTTISGGGFYLRSGRREEDHGVARAASPRSGTVAASVSTESGVESALANNEFLMNSTKLSIRPRFLGARLTLGLVTALLALLIGGVAAGDGV
jgi:hypothetical protein